MAICIALIYRNVHAITGLCISGMYISLANWYHMGRNASVFWSLTIIAHLMSSVFINPATYIEQFYLWYCFVTGVSIIYAYFYMDK